MNRAQSFLHLLLAVLMLTAILPVGGAVSDPATDAQESSIKGVLAGNSGPKGLGTLQSDWVLHNELHNLFFRSDHTLKYGNGGDCDDGDYAWETLYDPVLTNTAGTIPEDNDPGLGGVPVDFLLGPVGAQTEITQLTARLQLQATAPFTVHVQMLANGTARGPVVDVVMTGVVATLPAVVIPIYGVARDAPEEFTGIGNFATPVVFSPGEVLSVRLTAEPTGTGSEAHSLAMIYNCSDFPNRISFLGDVARTNTWTENKDKQADQSFPAAATASTVDRVVTLRVAHVSGFSRLALDRHMHAIQVIGPDNKVYYDNSPANFGPGTASAVNVPANQQWGAAIDDLARPARNQVTGDVAGALQMATYQIAYPNTLTLDGTYILRVIARGQNWHSDVPVIVGGAGSQLQRSTLEQVAAKTILVGERTSYRLTLTNAGSATDTFALNAEPNASPFGWSATVTPAQLTLAPGSKADVIVTVIPSSLGRNGESNDIRVTATSLNSGAVSKLRDANGAEEVLRVSLTSARTNGVRLVTERSEVSLGPGASTLIPFAVENTGNARDSFVISTQGAPLGWTISTSPSAFDLDGKSQVAPVLRIQAPAEATPGSSFTFTLRAVRAADASTSATETFTVRVFLADKFTFSLFGGTGSDGKPVLLPTTSIASPQVHFLRDEGPDGQVNAGDPLGQFSASSTPWDADSDWDKDFDQSTLFRLVLSNDGDRADNVRVVPKLLTGTTGFAADLATATQRAALGYQDTNQCEENDSNSDGDGINDGWRFRLIDPAASTNPTVAGGAANRQTYTDVAGQELTVAIPAHTVKVLYAEMTWTLPSPAASPCSAAANRIQGSGGGARAADPAPGHAVAIEAFSLNDPSQRNTHVLNARLVGHTLAAGEADDPASAGTPPSRLNSQTYSDQRNGVALHVDLHPTTRVLDGTSKKVALGDVAQRTATYNLRLVNTGNEADTMRVTMPQLQNGWEYSFAGITAPSLLNSPLLNEGHGKAMRTLGCTAPAVQNPTAAATARTIGFECTMGSFDEVAFQVKAVAPSNGVIGTFDVVRVTAQSKDSFQTSTTIADDVQLSTSLTGDFLFNLLPDVATQQVAVHPGNTAAVAFTLRNLGTEDDNVTLDLPVAPATGTGWTADFSLPNPVFLPAGRDVNGFLVVRAPASAAASAQEKFRIRATSLEAPGVPAPADLFDVTATVVQDNLNLNLTGDPLNVVATAGEAATLSLKASRSSSSTASFADIRLDASSLPVGWTSDTNGPLRANFAADGSAPAVAFKVTPPANALGTSRAAIRFTAVDSTNGQEFANVGVALSTPTIGVNLTSMLGNTILVAPGAATKVPLRIENLGVNLDSINLTASTVPTGWLVAFEARQVGVQPLQAVNTTMTVTAPATLEPGRSVLLRVVATTSDRSRNDVLDLNLTTGSSVPVMTPKTNGTIHLLPEEPYRLTMTVANNGTLGDDLKLAGALTGQFKDVVKVVVTPAEIPLEPNQAQDVEVEITLPAGLPSGLNVPVVIQAASKGPFLKSVNTTTIAAKVIEHKVRDIDGDLANEYAVDRDLLLANGYEAMSDPTPTGTRSSQVDPVALLSEAGAAAYTLVTTAADGTQSTVVDFQFDPDRDNRTDLLVDTTGDGIPDVYWDGDRGYSHAVPVLKDVTRDGREDYFFDLDGEGGFRLDVYYDALTGQLGDLIQVDLDNNGELDYVVDSNGNGVADPDETVLFGGPDGDIASIRETADVDGDGKDDVVVDTDGDGKPDYFVPNGEEAGVAIVLEDVNGDGIDDWTYDSNGNGLRDAYYDPATGEVGFIDAQGTFVDQLAKYWYVGALFGVVLALFVVLLMVTRK